MFGIIAKNRGMWGGIADWCTVDGSPELYQTRQEAEDAADRYNAEEGPINHFTDYFAREYPDKR